MAQAFRKLGAAGAPKGLGTGATLLIGAGAALWGIKSSVYNGREAICGEFWWSRDLVFSAFFVVDGGHRAIIFSRLGGIQNRVYAEGLHFRVPWFQYPIIYDIRTKPRRISSPTGSKGLLTLLF